MCEYLHLPLAKNGTSMAVTFFFFAKYSSSDFDDDHMLGSGFLSIEFY